MAGLRRPDPHRFRPRESPRATSGLRHRPRHLHAGSAACALAPNAGALIAARALQGAGGGLAVPLSLTLVSDAFPPERRGTAVGIWGAFSGVAVAFGPLVGGTIVDGLSWQWVFWVNVPVGLVAVGLATAKLTESRGLRRRLDLPGLALAAGAVFALVDALAQGNQAGWSSPTVLTLLIGGVVLGAAFVSRERHARQPMLPLGLFSDTSFSGGCAAQFAMPAVLIGGAFVIPQYLQLVLSQSPFAAGAGLLPWTGPVIVIAPLAGRLADQVGERPLIVTGLAAMAAAFAWLGMTLTSTTAYTSLIALLLLAGLGSAMVFPTAIAAVLRAAPPSQVGVASGASSTIRQVGAPFGVAIASAVFAAHGSYATPLTFVHGLRPALDALALIGLAGALSALGVKAKKLTVIPAAAEKSPPLETTLPVNA